MEENAMNRPDYLADVTQPVAIGEMKIEPGKYLTARQMGGMLLQASDDVDLHWSSDELRGSWVPGWFEQRDWNDQTLLFVRSGGFGDHLFLTPIFREVKKRWPRALVKLASLSRYREQLLHNPNIDGFEPYPLPLDAWNKADGRFWLDGAIENGQADQHAVDVFAAAVGITLSNKRTEYFYTQEELDWALGGWPRSAKRPRRLGVQVHASTFSRTYPFAQLRKALDNLYTRGWEIMLFGDENRMKAAPVEGIHVISGRTFRQAAAVLATCDVVLAPDSAFCHLAGALDIPTVALYGPFDAATRVAYQPSVFPIQGKAPCAPCSHHANHLKPWPDGCPALTNGGACIALEGIKPEVVAERVLSEYIKGAMRKGETV